MGLFNNLVHSLTSELQELPLRLTPDGRLVASPIVKQPRVSAEASAELMDRLGALDGALAIIEFSPEGHIVDANPNFLAAFGYDLMELEGEHHCTLVDADFSRTPEYSELWARLKRGDCFSHRSSLINGEGRAMPAHLTYSPVINTTGKVTRVLGIVCDLPQSAWSGSLR
ncbi:MAG TPA: PAS domain S-box protein [Candidatus Acidoferrum sp.]|nr:PAS domain S-box protein [Candidatus Acidoferrum sp.]